MKRLGLVMMTVGVLALLWLTIGAIYMWAKLVGAL